MNKYDSVSDLRLIILLVNKWKWVILLFAIVMSVATYFLSVKKMGNFKLYYTAHATLRIGVVGSVPIDDWVSLTTVIREKKKSKWAEEIELGVFYYDKYRFENLLISRSGDPALDLLCFFDFNASSPSQAIEGLQVILQALIEYQSENFLKISDQFKSNFAAIKNIKNLPVGPMLNRNNLPPEVIQAPILTAEGVGGFSPVASPLKKSVIMLFISIIAGIFIVLGADYVRGVIVADKKN